MQKSFSTCMEWYQVFEIFSLWAVFHVSPKWFQEEREPFRTVGNSFGSFSMEREKLRIVVPLAHAVEKSICHPTFVINYNLIL